MPKALGAQKKEEKMKKMFLCAIPVAIGIALPDCFQSVAEFVF